MSPTLIIISAVVVIFIIFVIYNYYKMKKLPNTPDHKNIRVLNNKNFKSLTKSGTVLVDFWAPWCGPCRAISPIVKELAAAFGDKIKFTKCNVDDNPITPGKFGIRSIPTLIFFNKGKELDKVVGIVAKSKLEEMISKV